MSDQLAVFLGTHRVGTLTADDNGRLSFGYVANASPLSLALPVRPQPYDDSECRPFFAGLLPEGGALARAAAARRLQIYETFRLLQAYGAECAGAVRLLSPDAAPIVPANYERLNDVALAQELAELEGNPNFARDQRVRLSVAGVQSKGAVRLFGDTIAKPLDGSPSTHILKVAMRDYPDLPANEALCMKLAAALGLQVADVTFRQVAETPFLLVTRYDRRVTDEHVTELHQEDMCQALAYLPERKYEIDPESGQKLGPGIAECMQILARTRVPAIDIPQFLSALVFNYLIGNADAHAKNFSILYDREGSAPMLAPLYDLVSTRIYPRLDTQFAMRLGGVADPEKMSRTAWEQVAADAGVRFRLLRGIAEKISVRILPATRQLMDTLGQGPPNAHILAVIGERLHDLSDALKFKVEIDTPPLILKAPGWAAMS